MATVVAVVSQSQLKRSIVNVSPSGASNHHHYQSPLNLHKPAADTKQSSPPPPPRKEREMYDKLAPIYDATGTLWSLGAIPKVKVRGIRIRLEKYDAIMRSGYTHS